MTKESNFVEIKGAKQNNLKDISIKIPRNSFVVFTGISGSGKSSIAFDTIYAEAQRRYFESVAPYARRLISQLPAPKVTEILGLPPAVALQQRKGDTTSRSSVGTVTTLSNLLRMLLSRAGTYPDSIKETLDSDAFSPNTPIGACQTCHGTGVIHDVSESSLVPDPSLSIREKAIAAWPGAWQGKNYRDILATMGYNVDIPWKKLSKKDRDWILFTEESPVVTVHPVREAHRIQRPYKGTYMSAASYVRHTYRTTQSSTLRKRVLQFMEASICSDCKGKKLNKDALSIKFGGFDIHELSNMSLSKLNAVLKDTVKKMNSAKSTRKVTLEVAKSISDDLNERIQVLTELGLNYLSLDRTTPTLSSGELQRLRLGTQLRSGLFGVVYVLDEPSAGLHPQDNKALLKMLGDLKDTGNSLFVVEHEMKIVEDADWIVDIGPGAGEHGGYLIYSGPVSGLAKEKKSNTRNYLFRKDTLKSKQRRKAKNWISLNGITKHNLDNIDVNFPLGSMTVVTGVSGAGKSTLVSNVLANSVREKLGLKTDIETDADGLDTLEFRETTEVSLSGIESISRLVCVDQKPIGRTPRSNLATYTGLFDHIRKKFASTREAQEKNYKVGRFSFNVEGGRCKNCEGEGLVSIELLFLPSVYAPCTVCKGSRYNDDTLKIRYKGLNISEVLDMPVESACQFFDEIPAVKRALDTLKEVGLGYLKLGQPATELSGGEAQRIKLATELQRIQKGTSLYILDEPTTGLHPHDIERLLAQLEKLVEAGNTVVLVENDMNVAIQADWVIDLGPGAGIEGGKIVVEGPPEKVAKSKSSRTAPYLKELLS